MLGYSKKLENQKNGSSERLKNLGKVGKIKGIRENFGKFILLGN